MNQHHLTDQKYYFPLIGTALVAASLFHFSMPVFAAGTEAGEILRNTATGSYQDDEGNTYTIDSNTVEVTVAKVAGITNQIKAFNDETSDATNTSVLTGDTVSFEFEITNVGNDATNIFIPDVGDIDTKGLDAGSLTVEVSEIDPATTPAFVDRGTLTGGIVENVPINGQIIVKVTGTVTATAAGAPIEVQLGDTGSNTDINAPVADTQNQPDSDDGSQTNEIRTVNASDSLISSDPNAILPIVTGDPEGGQKEASAVQQVFLGSNPLAMTRIEKIREIDDTLAANTDGDLDNNVITYNLELDVLSTTPNPLFTPGQLQGRDYEGRISGTNVTDDSNLVLISDAIPENTTLQSTLATVTENGRTWTPVYAEAEPVADDGTSFAAGQITWSTTPTNPADLSTVTRVGWVYDVDLAGVIEPGTTITGFNFEVITTGLNTTTGGTVANIAQVFGSTVNGENIFDESGDQDPSNFNGVNPGPTETAASSTGIADPSDHGIDSENNNNLFGTDDPSPGGEDNVATIGAPGTLINGPGGNPSATGNIFITDPDNNHDFQNKGISNFADANGSNNMAQHNQGHTLTPASVIFDNTLSNPGTLPLTDVLLQPINPDFGSIGGENDDLPEGTKVTINLGTQQAIYTYTSDGAATPTFSFVLDGNTAAQPSQPITIPTLAAEVPLDYQVTVDLPAGTRLSTDNVDITDESSELVGGFPVPIIVFQDDDDDGTPDETENSNVTVNQVYTGFIRISKEVAVFESDGTTPRAGDPLPGDILLYTVNYRNISEPQAGSGNNLILNGIDVKIDENGTLDNLSSVTDGNNWALDNNDDDDMDTINVQNSATDSNGGTITFYTGISTDASAAATDNYSVESLTSAGTTDPGDTVTGYRSVIPLVAPAADNSTFTFRRKVDEFDGLPQEGLEP